MCTNNIFKKLTPPHTKTESRNITIIQSDLQSNKYIQLPLEETYYFNFNFLAYSRPFRSICRFQNPLPRFSVTIFSQFNTPSIFRSSLIQSPPSLSWSPGSAFIKFPSRNRPYMLALCLHYQPILISGF